VLRNRRETGIEVACAVYLDGFAPGIVTHRHCDIPAHVRQLARDVHAVIQDIIPYIRFLGDGIQSIQDGGGFVGIDILNYGSGHSSAGVIKQFALLGFLNVS